MTGDLVVAVDCSTTAAKAVAVDAAGTVVAAAARPLATATPAVGFHEQDAATWYSASVGAVAEVVAALADPARAAAFFAGVGTIAETGAVDGLRFVFASGDVVHYRPSGNAPELRCYTEAGSAERADALLAWGLAAAERAVR